MAYSYTDQRGDGVTRSFNFGFVGEDKGYIRASDIQVWSSPDWRGWQQVSGWTLSGTNQITFLTPPANGTTIRIRRVVDKVKPFAKFDRSVTLDMQSLNNAFIQMLEVSHEIMDGFFPAGFFFKDDLNMGGNSITNMREGVNGTDAVNFDQLQVQKIRNDQQDQRLQAIESSMVDNVGTRTVPYYLVAVGGETRWQLPLPFQQAILYINGVFQNQNLGAFSVSGNGFNFAEPLQKGDEVYALLGSGVATPSDYITYAELAASGSSGLIGSLPKPVTWAGFAGGADRSGVNNSDAAFIAASSYPYPVYIPDGVYSLSVDIPGDFLEATAVTYNSTGRALPKQVGFWSEQGTVRIHRLRDRVFIGNAVTYDARFNPIAASFLTAAAGYDWLERSAQMHVCHQAGGAAIVGSSRSSDKNGVVGQTCIGLSAYAWADSGPGSAWGAYVEAVRGAGVASNIFGMELTAKNLGTDTIITSPYNIFSAGSTIGLWLGAGGDGSLHPAAAAPSTAAIVIGKNGQRWQKGIQFQSNGLVGTDGGGYGKATAIEMARGHSLDWRYSSQNGSIGGGIYSTNNSKAQATFVSFTLNGLEIHGYNSDQSSEVPLLRVLPNPSAVNFIEVRAGSAGGRPNLAMQGSDTNIDLVLTPKGTGTVRPAGSLAPHTSNALTCGTASNVWATGYTNTAFTVTSDMRNKMDITPIFDKILDAWGDVDWQLYRLTVDVEQDPSTPYQAGLMAQEVLSAFITHGVDAINLGVVTYNKWDESIDTDTGVVTPAGDCYGINYTHASALEAALQRRNMKRMEERLAKLEALLN